MTILFAGGEDSDFLSIGGGGISTSVNNRRSSYSRCALGGINTFGAWISGYSFSASSFWTTLRVNNMTTSGNAYLFTAYDTNFVRRLQFRCSGNIFFPATMNVEKVNAAGSATSLGTYTQPQGTAIGGQTDKIDIFVNYAVSGQILIYMNGLPLFSYSGDVTTDSVTSLCHVGTGVCGSTTAWFSEMIVADVDTRNFSLQTLAPVANGNTHNWDTGSPAAANVNEITLDDTTLDGSTTAGQIDQYTIPAPVSGSLSIMAVGISARMTKGTTGPSKMDLGVRSSGADYWSSDLTLITAWGNYQNWWSTDPATSAAWTGLPTNIGLKSVT